MELLIAIGAFVLHFIINSLAWAWVGMCLGTGALAAYKIYNGSLAKASLQVKQETTEATA